MASATKRVNFNILFNFNLFKFTKIIPGGENSRCKGLEAEMNLAYVGKRSRAWLDHSGS